MLIPIAKLRLDGGTQPRVALNFATVDDYMDAMVEGYKFPPVTAFYDGTDYWLADGFHRVTAAQQASLTEIDTDVHQGTREDAQWYSFSANTAHGLRRTNEDKQRAVRAALMHPNGAGKSDSTIAKHVGVDHVTVARWREKMTASCEIHKIDSRTVTRNGTTYQQDTANIGVKPKTFAQEVKEIVRHVAHNEGRLDEVSEPAERPKRTSPDAAAEREGIERDKRLAAEMFIIDAIRWLANPGLSVVDAATKIVTVDTPDVDLAGQSLKALAYVSELSEEINRARNKNATVA